MRQGAMLAGALGLGFAGGCLGALLCAGTPESASPPGGTSAEAGAHAAAIARLEARIDALATAARSARPADAGRASGEAEGATTPSLGREGRADPVDAGGASAAAPGSAQQPGTGTQATPDALRKLEERVAVLERGGRALTVIPEDLSKVPPAEMEVLLRNLQSEKRYADAIRVADEYARRPDITADQRAEAELNAGYALRSMGKHAEAETRFRDTLARVGEQSEKGAWVGFQLAWERYYQQDVAGAAAEMEKAANNPAVSPIVRVHGLYNGGRFAKESGDTARARAMLERLVRDHAGDIPASQAFMRTEADRMLKEINGQ